MGEERWFLENGGDDEFGFQWNLMLQENGRLRCVAQYLEEDYAVQGLAAHKWLDSLGSGKMSLAMEGIVIDSNGKITKRRTVRKHDTMKCGGKQNGVNDNPAGRKPNRKGAGNK